jgi:hypothetical protein
MGTDIHVFLEKKDNDGNYISLGRHEDIFYRSYGLFGFLADVRNYSVVPYISKCRGLPANVSKEIKEYSSYDYEYYGFSWFDIGELLNYDYEQIIEDRRCTIDGDGGCTCEPGQGKQMTLREFLGSEYFNHLDIIKSRGADRIIICFDG